MQLAYQPHESNLYMLADNLIMHCQFTVNKNIFYVTTLMDTGDIKITIEL